jgi:hypothetical protein
VSATEDLSTRSLQQHSSSNQAMGRVAANDP